ncbi:MAG: hypothetical protein LBU07_04165 [Coriobacteriales bacterium]|nr:hypothetical protein [Coriobacteriales bacterium]
MIHGRGALKKALTILLALFLVVGTVPPAFAADGDVVATVPPLVDPQLLGDESGYVPGEIITTLAQSSQVEAQLDMVGR